MGQTGSHRARSAKHRQSARSLPDVANHRLMDEAATWDAYANGQYLVARQAPPSDDAMRRSRSLAPKTRKSAANGAGRPRQGQRYDCQSFASFERSYLARHAPDGRTTPSNRQGPRSFDGHYVRGNATAAFRERGSERRVDLNGSDCNWSDVASDMFRMSKRRDQQQRRAGQRGYGSSGNESKCGNGTGRFARKGSRQGHLDQVPENSPCDATQEPRSGPNQHLIFRVDSRENSPIHKPPLMPNNGVAAAGCELRGGGALASRVDGHCAARNDCDKVVIRSLRRELNEERLRRMKLEQNGAKMAEALERLKCENERLRVDLESSLRRLRRDAVDRKEKDAEGRLCELRDRVERLEQQKREQKDAYDACLKDVAGEVARAVVNEKTLRAECVRLQRRLYELEWKNKIGGLLAGSANRDERDDDGPKSRPHSPGFYPENEDYDPAQPSDANDEMFYDEYDALISQAAARDEMHQNASAPSERPVSSGGEALCSRPSSFNFDAAASVTPNDLSTTRMVVNVVRVVSNPAAAAAFDVKRRRRPLFTNFRATSIDDDVFLDGSISKMRPGRRGEWRSLENLAVSPAVVRPSRCDSDSRLLKAAPGSFSAAFGEVLQGFLNNGSHLTEFERDVLLQKLDHVRLRMGANSAPPAAKRIALNNQKTTAAVAIPKKAKPPSSANASCASDDSSEYYGEKLLMRDRWNQLRRKKNVGKSAVVRYKPSGGRAVIVKRGSCLLRNYVFHRFGRPERQALTHFDFLNDETAAATPPPPANADADETVYENAPFQRFCRLLGPFDADDDDDLIGDLASTSPDDDRRRRRVDADDDDRDGVIWSTSSSDGGSSLYLSRVDLATTAADVYDRSSSSDVADDSFTTQSSVSVVGFGGRATRE